jgi:glycosyltransferase (activator-dependent family)
MRVLFTVFAAKAHLYNSVPLAWALRSAGHEVCIASQPDLIEDITRTGLPAVSVGSALNLMQTAQEVASDEAGYGVGYDIAETRPEKLTWDYVRGALNAYCTIHSESVSNQAFTEDLLAFARHWKPDLVVWDALTYAGPIVAHATGAAHVRMLFGLDHSARMRNLYLEMAEKRPAGDREDLVAEWLGKRLEPLGLEFEEDLVLGQASIDPMPSWMRFPIELNNLPLRCVPFNGPSVIPPWIHEPPQRPRVCLTLGLTLAGVRNEKIPLPDMVSALASLDVDVIAAVRADQFSSLDDVPDNVRLVDFVPLNELLPSCSAIIHNGGTGTTGNAIVHGVPQVIVPAWLWDETGVAKRLEQRGAGAMIEREEFSADLLRSRVEKVLQDASYRQNASQLRTEMLQTPSPREVARQLEELVRNR